MKQTDMDIVNINCPICGNINFKYKFSGKDYYYHTNCGKTWNVFECYGCGLEQLSIKEQHSFYPENYYSYVDEGGSNVEKRKRRKMLSDVGIYFSHVFDDSKLGLPTIGGKGKNFLDIGCGAGKNLKIMKKRGWNVRGFEISDSTTYQNEIYYGKSIVDIDFGETYDFIWCNHVFEHVYNPIDFLNKCKSILNDDGVLVINLPNVKCLSSKIYGKYAVERDIPRHLYGYSFNNVKTFFEKVGFKIIYKSYQQNYGGLQSFSRYIYDKFGKDVSQNFLCKVGCCFFDVILSLGHKTNSMGFILKK